MPAFPHAGFKVFENGTLFAQGCILKHERRRSTKRLGAKIVMQERKGVELPLRLHVCWTYPESMYGKRAYVDSAELFYQYWTLENPTGIQTCTNTNAGFAASLSLLAVPMPLIAPLVVVNEGSETRYL